MSYSKVKTFRPCSPSTSDQESPSANKKSTTTIPDSTKDVSISPVPTINHNNSLKDSLFSRKKSDGSVSDASTNSIAGGKLTEAPGRLTPTCPGRIKAPPICRNRALKRVASTVSVSYVAFCLIMESNSSCAHNCIISQ